ncbi:NACHT domain-containing protein [Melittangium boletus]|uniref:NACHT domain-containing protein n=1 Tax=Melittangium boletus TaxID=83453 RepID=UPI003DA684A7
MQKKTRLLLSDLYGRLFVATHCAELIDAGEFGGEGPVRLRVEDSSYPLWDDLVEEYADGSIHGWQVKHQRTPLDPDTLAEQLRQLAASKLSRGHLALHSLEDIPGVGSLVSLAELCERLRQPQIDSPSVLRSMPATQRKWVDFGRHVAQLGSEEECLRTFQRLEIIQLGSSAHLNNQLLKDLRRWYEDPKAVLTKLLDFLARHPDEAVVVDYPLLRDQVLAGHTPAQRRGQTSTRQRERYLQEVVQAHERLPLLNGLGTHLGAENAPLRLKDVFVAPRLRQVAPHAKELESDADEASATTPGEPRGRTSRKHLPLPGSQVPSRLMSLHELVDGLLTPETLPSRVLLIEAPVGSGKSMLLEQLRHDLAQAGLGNERAPLPLLLDAADLRDGRLEDAARRKLPLPEGLSRPDPEESPSLYLVDGLDEVPPSDRPTVARVLGQLGQAPGTAALVLTCRPGIAFSFPRAPTRLRIAPWTRDDIERFLEHWRQHRPTQVEALGSAWRHEPLRSAMSNPLTATFSLLLAEERPEVLGNRTALFGGIIDKLFQEWVRFREGRENPSRLPLWSEVSGALQKLARDAVSGSQHTLSAQDLRKSIRTVAPTRDLEWLNAASTHFGLLVPQGPGTYRFVLRSLAEYLAGADMYRREKDHFMSRVSRRWAEEPVRHAIGLTAQEEGPAAALTLLEQLIPSRKAVFAQDAREALRATLVAARAAQDLGTAAGPIAERLAEPLVAFLTEPTSTWMPERIAEVVQALAREGGPCWDAVLRLLRERLRAPGTFAAWAAALPISHAKEGLVLLRVSDAQARAAITCKLAPYVDEQEVRDALILQLFDAPGYNLRGVISPILAGLVLRRARRDEPFAQQVRPALLRFLHWEAQLASGSAAIALLPQEADPQQLAEALALLGMGYPCPREVLDALAATPEGQAAITKTWPEWTRVPRGVSLDELPRVPPTQDARAPAPLTEFVLPVVLQAMGPALARMTPAERLALGIQDDTDIIGILCEQAPDHPEGILGALKAGTNPSHLLQRDKQLALRDAAARHPPVARALLVLWGRLTSNKVRAHFPGLALDTLVAEGNLEAAHAFADWLTHTFLFNMPTPPLPISLATLRHPIVRDAALARAREAWRQYREGDVALSIAAVALGSLRPAWEADAALEEALRQESLSGNDATLFGLMSIFWDPPFPEGLRTRVRTRIEELLDDPDEEVLHYLGGYLPYAERTQDIERLRPRLESWTAQASWLRYTAALTLLALLTPPEAEALSARCAGDWPQAWQPVWNSDTDLSRLVAANPRAWHARLERLLDENAMSLLLSGVPLFELAQSLLPRLAREEQRTLLDQLARTLGHFQHPWLSRGTFPEAARRPADFFHELAFDIDTD